MIRLTGGSFRGRKIGCPKGKAVRPTTAFVRESLFSILGSGIKGCHWLDVFAGCGIVGFRKAVDGGERGRGVSGVRAPWPLGYAAVSAEGP